MSFIYTIPEQHCRIIKRFNKFARVQYSGIRFRIPFIEKFHEMHYWEKAVKDNNIDMKLMEHQTDTEPRTTQTRDNVTVRADASVYWRIFEPARAAFEVDRLPTAIFDITLNALRSQIGRMELDEVLSERDRLNKNIAEELFEVGESWGVKIKRVEIRQLDIDRETRRSMNQQMDAERRRRARVAEAEGDAEATVTVAEADKQADIKRASGHAKALKIIAEAEKNYLDELAQQVGSEKAAEILIAQKFIQGFDTITKNPADRVFLPNSYQTLLSITDQQTAKMEVD